MDVRFQTERKLTGSILYFGWHMYLPSSCLVLLATCTVLQLATDFVVMDVLEGLRWLVGIGGTGTHTLKLGEPGPDDVLLYQSSYRKGDKFLRKVSHRFTYTAKDNEEITAVVAEDQWVDDTGGNPELVSGGVGQREVAIEVTSRVNRGFHFYFYVYGVRKVSSYW